MWDFSKGRQHLPKISAECENGPVCPYKPHCCCLSSNQMFSLSSLYAHLGKKILNLEEERVLKVETLNQLCNASDISSWFIWVLINFCTTGYFLVPTGEKESLDSRLSSLVVAFLDAASTRMFAEALYVVFLKLCSLMMPPLLQGTAERKNTSVQQCMACPCLKSSVCEFSKWEKISNCFLWLS